MSVDPRAWNIVAGVCVASGCGSRVIAQEAGDETIGSVGTEQTGPECSTTQDCPYGYYCYDGVCEYVPHVDGHIDHTDEYWYGDCYSDYECDALSLCNFDYCEAQWSPPLCPSGDLPLPIAVPDVALALAFVDADADGIEELAVASETDIHLFESGAPMPISSPRQVPSAYVDGMVGGSFDQTAGEDLLLMFDDELHPQLSAGDGSFGPGMVVPSGYPALRLAAGPFDMQPLDDLLLWGPSGGMVLFELAQGVTLNFDGIQDASVRSLATPVPGYVYATAFNLNFHQVDGSLITSLELGDRLPVALTSFAELGDGYDLGAVYRTGNGVSWTLLQEWGPATGNMGSQWGVLGQVRRMVSGDFDGDMRADIAMIVDLDGMDHLYIQSGVHEQGCLGEYLLGAAVAIMRELAVGDHDGDGDDELAVRLSTGLVWLVDGG